MMDHVEIVDFATYEWRCTLCGKVDTAQSDAEAKGAVVQHLADVHHPALLSEVVVGR